MSLRYSRKEKAIRYNFALCSLAAMSAAVVAVATTMESSEPFSMTGAAISTVSPVSLIMLSVASLAVVAALGSYIPEPRPEKPGRSNYGRYFDTPADSRPFFGNVRDVPRPNERHGNTREFNGSSNY